MTPNGTMRWVKRGPRGSGIDVDPARVREARLEAGLSLGQVSGDDVSRTFIHLIEHGRARPSRQVLEIIARRTKKPVGYFTRPRVAGAPNSSLANQLIEMAERVRLFAGASGLTAVERQAMKLIEVILYQAAELARSVHSRVIIDEPTEPPPGFTPADN
jgi:transcriptional regulator with XRE-family HTH domain